MNTNIKIELTDEQRMLLHNRLTGKETKKMVSRANVKDMIQGFVDSMLHQPTEPNVSFLEGPTSTVITAQRLCIPDPEDTELLAGKTLSYIMGWNKVKHRS